jgi:2-methylisocitrate lyase-like PEP mutase family enzyme
LITGLGEEEALQRGAAYVETGADAILIHSKKETPDEILSFYGAWSGDVPLVIVPTSYPQLSFAEVATLDNLRRRFFNFASNAVNQRRHSAQAFRLNKCDKAI